ncbi:MAG: phytase [Cellvibrionales bacterium]|nr:phytase [Cellvibrionales bacterium]
MKKFRWMSTFIFTFILGCFIVACANQSKQSEQSSAIHASTIVVQKQQVNLDNLSDLLPLGKTRMIASSETQGLWMLTTDPTQKNAILLRGEFDALGKVGEQFGVVDTKNNQLTIFSLPLSGIKIHQKIKPKKLLLEGFCEYKSPIDNNRYLYLFDGLGWVEQYLAAEEVSKQGKITERWLKQPVFIKSWQVGNEVTSCVAVSESQSLYISEPNIGIFRYPAEAEGDLKRDLIAVAEPLGQLPADVTGLVVVNPKTLMLVNKETDQLYTLDLESFHVNTLKINGLKDTEIEKLHRLNHSVVAIDKVQQSLYQWPMMPLFVFNKSEARIQETPVFTVNAVVETPEMNSTGDTADDPAIWVNQKYANKSRVLATNKKSGLLVYNLKGKLIQEIPHGHVNNVDVRYGMSIGGQVFDIAASSNRSNNSISLYRIYPKTGLVSKDSDIPLTLKAPYGLCMGKQGGQLTVWVNDKSGLFVEYRLSAPNGKIKATKAREFALKTQPEGCFMDDKNQRLYVGEEDEGVWVVDLSKAPLTIEPVIKVGETLVADAEGISMAYQGYQGKDVLVISSQGDNSYVLVEANAPFAVLGKFRITIDGKKGIDGVSETDGLAVTTANIGGHFKEGLLVVQDGYNVMPNKAQNFKFVPWASIKKGLAQ